MTIVAHSFEIAKRLGQGRDSRKPARVPPFSETWLAQTAASMTGSFHWPIDASLPSGRDSFGAVWNYRMANNNSSDSWSPVAVWNPVDQRVYGFLDRTAGADTIESTNLLGYDAKSHAWINYPIVNLSGKWGLPHVYGRWALDVGRQKIYRNLTDLWVFDIASETWEKSSAQNHLTYMGVAMHEDFGEMMGIDQSGNILAWNPDTDVRRTVGTTPRVGRHSHSHYNPIRHEWFSAWGDTGRTFTIVDRFGNITSLDFHSKETMGGSSSGSFPFYDPLSGNYLIYHRTPTRTVWELAPDFSDWLPAITISDTPDNFPTYHGHLIAPIPDSGVVMWLHRSTVSGGKHQRLYKHGSVFE